MNPQESRPGPGAEAANKGSAPTYRVTDSTDIPDYLSSEWWALSVDDWHRPAAVTIAANRWHAIATSAYGWALLDEAEDWHRRKTFSDWSSAVAEMVKGRRLGPSYRELERRRSIPSSLPEQFAQRHGGEYRGGPVDWATGRPARKEAA
jgi:hypothetical protein